MSGYEKSRCSAATGQAANPVRSTDHSSGDGATASGTVRAGGPAAVAGGSLPAPEAGGPATIAGSGSGATLEAGEVTPPCLIKGGETHGGECEYEGPISCDFLRFTLRGKALASWNRSFAADVGELVRAKAQGFDRVEMYSCGWVRRSSPWGGGDYESWEYPGALPTRELERVRLILADFALTDEVVPTAVHLAWDVVGQSFPRADQWYERYAELEAASTAEEPEYFTKGGARTCRIGSRQADLFWRIYDKGRKLQREGIDAETDWVRVECEFHKGWAADQAFSAVLAGDGQLFAIAARHYFRGKLARQWLPMVAGELKRGVVEHPGHIKKLRALLEQYGPMLRELQGLGMLDACVNAAPEGSRTSQWRAGKFRDECKAYGIGQTVLDLGEVLHGAKRTRERLAGVKRVAVASDFSS